MTLRDLAPYILAAYSTLATVAFLLAYTLWKLDHASNTRRCISVTPDGDRLLIHFVYDRGERCVVELHAIGSGDAWTDVRTGKRFTREHAQWLREREAMHRRSNTTLKAETANAS